MMLPASVEYRNRPGPDAGEHPDGARSEINVTHVSTSDRRGGAAIAANRLHHALPDVGVRSRMLVAQRFGRKEADVLEYNPLAPAPAIFGRAFFRIGRRWHRPSFQKAGAYFTPEWTLTGGRLLSQLPPSQVVNLHWVTDLLHYRTLPELAAHVPVVWTLHDMNPFTGGCHYSGPCDRYQARCGACPQLKTSEGDHDMTRGIWERKREIYGRIPPHRLTLVCPSRWLAHEARLSSLCREFDVRVIPNGIDLHDYHPVSQTHAREQLGLPPGARIVLFVAEQIEDRRKGLGFLLEAFDAVRNIPDLLLVTLGTSNNSLLTGPRFRHLGSMATSAQLRVAYSAADVFVIPSLQDNLPNTLIESMACGTPVVGFAAGGISEAVINGRTGLLAPPGDVAALAANLRRALEDGLLRRALAGESLFRVEQEYTIQRQARRYAALYHEILRAPRPSAAPAHPIP